MITEHGFQQDHLTYKVLPLLELAVSDKKLMAHCTMVEINQWSAMTLPKCSVTALAPG